MLTTILFILFLILLPMFPQLFRHRGRIGQPGLVRRPEEKKPADQPSEPETPRYEPKAIEVVVVKAILQKKLPAELINTIIDYAEYWPHTSSVTNFERLPEGKRKVAGQPNGGQNIFMVRSRPLGFIKSTQFNGDYATQPPEPRSPSAEYPVNRFQRWIGGPEPTLEHPCRKIVFTIHSRDQGWAGNRADTGTYRGSWTWFEPGLERFEAGCADSEHSGSDPDDSPISPANQTEDLGSPSDDSSMDQGVLTPDYSEDSNPIDPTDNDQSSLDADSLRTVLPLLEPPNNGEDPTIRRLHHDLMPSNMKIQCNVTATKETKVHRVEWSWTDNIHPDSRESDELDKKGRGRATGNGEFVRNMKLGDVVTVWAKARFPMWVNHVEKVQIDVYWAL